LKGNDHLCQVRNTAEVIPNDVKTSPDLPSPPSLPPKASPINTIDITLDDQLPTKWKKKFDSAAHKTYQTVFEPSIRRYNDCYGKISARVNIGPVSPPNRKLRIPSYSSEHQNISKYSNQSLMNWNNKAYLYIQKTQLSLSNMLAHHFSS